MARTETRDDVVERLEYSEACDRANELRTLAEHYVEQARFGIDPGEGVREEAARGAARLALALVYGLLEVGARLELLELDAELGREASK